MVTQIRAITDRVVRSAGARDDLGSVKLSSVSFFPIDKNYAQTGPQGKFVLIVGVESRGSSTR